MAYILIVVFIGFGLMYYMQQRQRIRRDLRRESKQEKFDELLETLRKQHSDKDVQGSDTTEAS